MSKGLHQGLLFDNMTLHCILKCTLPKFTKNVKQTNKNTYVQN